MIEISTPVNASSFQENFQANPFMEEGLDEGDQQFMSHLNKEFNRISMDPASSSIQKILDYSLRTANAAERSL